jgi:hypothetical protein
MAGSSDKRDATRQLRGTVWTTYQSGNVTGASQDRTLILCRNGSFVLKTSFVAPYIEDSSSYDHPYGESRVTGRWRVRRARIARNRRSGTALVAYVTDTGERGSVILSAGPRGARVAGIPAELTRGAGC